MIWFYIMGDFKVEPGKVDIEREKSRHSRSKSRH